MKLSDTLKNYRPAPGEEQIYAELCALYESMGNFSCERACPAHVTSSAFVINEAADAALLVRHDIMGRFVWPGGHNDGEEDCLAVALRETEEETGLAARPASGMPFMLNRFAVPAHVKNGERVAEHTHFSLAYLLIAEGEPRPRAGENSAAIWVPFSELERVWAEGDLPRRCMEAARRAAEEKAHAFAAIPDLLLPWFYAHKRILPWREERNPYATWVSEIMLQQTRVEAVKEYFVRFLAELPDVYALAACEEEKLMKLWEGLGYYSRARNLQKAAERIVSVYGGKLPADRGALSRLPGIGAYTAGAISSIAFGLPEPAVDGNVLRVISRITEDFTNIDLPECRKNMTSRLRAVYPPDAGAFTESLMELGAIVCVPNGAPHCDDCPIQHLCEGFHRGNAAVLPLRAAKKARRVENRTVLVVRCGQLVGLRQRPKKGLLAGLWELPSLDGHLSPDELRAALTEMGWSVRKLLSLRPAKHIFTHVEWHMNGVYVELDAPAPALTFVTPAELRDAYALPSAFRSFVSVLED